MFSSNIYPVIHPRVIPEDLVSRFRYWSETVREGMCFDGELYTCFRSFSAAHRLNAYAEAYEQIEQGNTVCVTASDTHYIIWFCLRAHVPTQDISGNPDLPLNDRPSREEKAVCLESESLSMTEMPLVLSADHLPPDANDANSDRRQNLNVS